MVSNVQQRSLSVFFGRFLESKSIFSGKEYLQASYVPEGLLHRAEQTEQLANMLAPSLRLEQPSNIFLYGKTGTGKTATVRHALNALLQIALERHIPLRGFYINCKLKKVADTEYRLIAHLARQFGKAVPSTGLPTQEIYS